MTWQKASDYCKIFGGDLTSIHNKEEDDFIRSKFILTFTLINKALTKKLSFSYYIFSFSIFETFYQIRNLLIYFEKRHLCCDLFLFSLNYLYYFNKKLLVALFFPWRRLHGM